MLCCLNAIGIPRHDHELFVFRLNLELSFHNCVFFAGLLAVSVSPEIVCVAQRILFAPCVHFDSNQMNIAIITGMDLCAILCHSQETQDSRSGTQQYPESHRRLQTGWMGFSQQQGRDKGHEYNRAYQQQSFKRVSQFKHPSGCFRSDADENHKPEQVSRLPAPFVENLSVKIRGEKRRDNDIDP